MPRKVPLFDMQRQNAQLREQLSQAIHGVCESTRYVLGPECTQLEDALAGYCGVPHAIACASGSDALLLALMALDIGPNDEVIVPSFTFFATASAVVRLGAHPVFVDIDPEHYLIDPASVQAAVTSATKAIIPVHLFGQCADMAALGEIAKRHNLSIVEDAAQALGAECNGARAGGIGDIGCFSFYPTKNLGGFGDGGMMVARREELAAKLRLLRAHGMHPRYYHHLLGINSRLDTLQAAILLVKLNHLESWHAMRKENATRYQRLIWEAGLTQHVSVPGELSNCRHVWNQFTLRVPQGHRDGLRAFLAEHGVGTEVYYPVPLHLQPCFADQRHAGGNLPVTEQASAEVLSLPIYPELTGEEQEYVIEQIKGYFASVSARSIIPAPKFLKYPQRDMDAANVLKRNQERS